jgi:hypothetical protein
MKTKSWFNPRSLAFECWLIFLVCIVVYLANGRTISNRDTFPNTMLAFNWIFNHQPHFDAFRDNYLFNKPVWFLTESFSGHLTSVYPIGVAIVIFPFYVIFSIVVWLNSVTHDTLLHIGVASSDITRAIFEPTRLFFEKLAATLITSIAVVIFYISTNLKFDKSICLILTFVYAFATQIWVTGSQALWQQSAANLVVCSILLCLLKANRSQGKNRKFLLFLTGICCGLIVSIRPTDVLFTIAAIIYVIVTYRRESVFLCLGLPSVLLSVSWNFYYFGTFLLGGYSTQTNLYSFTADQFVRSFLGLLVSPSRGFFIFSPVMLFAIPGAIQVFKLRSERDERLLLCLTSAGVALFLNYCFFSVWWGGWTYGSRFMVDALSVFCFLIGYPLTTHLKKVSEGKKKLLNSGFVCFLTLMTISTSVEIVGASTLATGDSNWFMIPEIIDMKTKIGMGRLWSFRDSPIERGTRTLLHRLNRSPADSPSYIKGLDGKIKQVRLADQQTPLTLLSSASGASVLIQVDLQNTGASQWLSYERGFGAGTMLVKTQFYNSEGAIVKEGQLYVLGSPRQAELTQASGFITLPTNLGTYRLVLSLMGAKEFAKDSSHSYELQVNIDPKEQIFSQKFSDVRVPKIVSAGKTFNVFAIAQSYSNFIWATNSKASINRANNPVTFSYRWLNSKGEFEVREGEQTRIPWSIFYNYKLFYNIWNNVGINATIKAPDRPGDYILRLTMVQEGVGWFDEKGAKPKDIPVTVTQS